jgi:hypothetical protein
MREEGNGDGRFTDLTRVQPLCPKLAKALQKVSSSRERGVKALEHDDFVPSGTTFFSSPLPRRSNHPDWRRMREQRQTWINAAVNEMRGRDLVFLDPDNGLAPVGYSKSKKNSAKYAWVDEINQFSANGSSVILYQHLPRMSVQACFEAVASRLRPRAEMVWAIRFRGFGVRLYFVIANEEHRSLLLQRTLELTNGPWGKHFRLLGDPLS